MIHFFHSFDKTFLTHCILQGLLLIAADIPFVFLIPLVTFTFWCFQGFFFIFGGCRLIFPKTMERNRNLKGCKNANQGRKCKQRQQTFFSFKILLVKSSLRSRLGTGTAMHRHEHGVTVQPCLKQIAQGRPWSARNRKGKGNCSIHGRPWPTTEWGPKRTWFTQSTRWCGVKGGPQNGKQFVMMTRHASNRVCVWFHERTVCERAPYLWKHEILQQLSWYQHVKRWMHRRWPDQWRWKI